MGLSRVQRWIRARSDVLAGFLAFLPVYEGILCWMRWLAQAPDGLMSQYSQSVYTITPEAAVATGVLEGSSGLFTPLALLPFLFLIFGLWVRPTEAWWSMVRRGLLFLTYLFLVDIFAAAFPIWSAIGFRANV